MAQDNVSEIISTEAERQLVDLQTGLTNAADQLERIGRLAKGITIDFKGAKDLGTLTELQEKVTAATKKMEKAQRDFADEIDRAQVREEAAVNKFVQAEERKAASAAKAAAAAEKAEERKAASVAKAAAAAEKAAQREAQAIGKLTNDYEILKKAYIDQANYAKQLGVTLGTNNKQFKDASASAMVMYDRLLKVEKAVGQGQRAVGQYNQAAFAMQQILRETPAFAYSFGTGILAISNNIPILVDEIGRLKVANEELKASGAKTIPIWKTLLSSVLSPSGLLTIGVGVFTLLATKMDIFKNKTVDATDANKKFNDGLKSISQQMGENIAKEQSISQQYIKTAANINLSLKSRVDAINNLRKASGGLLDDLNDEYFLAGKTAEAEERLNKAIYARFVAQAFGEKAALAMKKKFELTTGSVDENGKEVGSPLDLAAIAVKKAEKNLERVKALNKAEKDAAKVWQDVDESEGLAALEQKVTDAKKAYKDVESQIVDASRAVEKFNKQQQDALLELQGLQPKVMDENLQNLKAELSVRQSVLETMRLAKGITADTKASEVDSLISKDPEFGKKLKDQMQSVKQLEDLISKIEGKKANKTGNSGTGVTSPTNEAVQAAYDASIKELQITADKNKAIYEDDKRSQDERLKAYSIYNAAILSIMQQQRDKEIQIEIDKLQVIQEQLKTAKGQEKQNLYDAAYAGNIRIATLNKAFDADNAANTEKAKKDILNIVYGANEEWIKSETFRNEKMKELTIGLYLQDEALLQKQLQNKEITQRQYDKKMRDLQRSQGVALLNDDIALYESILANDNITAERRLDIQKKLNAALKQKGDITSKGDTPIKGGKGRITDSLGKALGITEDDSLQAFYDRSVQLANNAADAIIAAKERQFQAEQDMLDKKKESIQASYEMELDYINATTRNEQERATKIAQLQAQKATQDAEIEAKKREVAVRQAQFEKAAAITSIITQTAVAIATSLKYGPIVVALIAAAGAVQLAKAATAPIPAYAEGTDGHTGGLFFAGDGGEPEYIKAPNKKGYWSASSTTLYNEPKGTTVTPMSKFVDVVGNYNPQVMQKESERKLFEYLGDEFAKHLWKHGENLSHVIMSAQPKQQKVDIRETVIQLQRLGK
jgi:hypothetical protein